jgi:glycosyl hydrolase family 43
VRQGYKRATRTLRAGLATGSLLMGGLVTTTVVGVHAAGATVSVSGMTKVSTLDTPDPDVVYSGSGTKYYAYATGTNTFVTPTTGTVVHTSVPARWTTLHGRGTIPAGGISITPLSCTKTGCAITGVATVALRPTNIPSSITIKYGLQAPSVANLGSHWVMYYAARTAASGKAFAIYDATSSSPTTGFHTPSTRGSIMYQGSTGGSTDPSVLIDNSGNAWLQWKSSTYTGDNVAANLWSMLLTATGLHTSGGAHVLISQPTTTPNLWDSATIENPDMIYSGGTYYLFYSGGLWGTPTYSEGYVTCSAATGGCGSARRTSHEVLHNTTSAPYGPGGASLFTATTGNWLMAYHGWNLSCTNYFGFGCGASRQLYVNKVSGLSPTTPQITSFTSSTNTLSATGGTVTLTAHATGAASYTFTTSPSLTGLPATVRTTVGSAGVTVGIPANTSSSVETYTFTVTASGLYGGRVSSQLNVLVGAPGPAAQLDPDSAYAPTIFFEGSNHTMVNDYYTPSNGTWNSTTPPGSAYSAPAAQLDPDSAYAPTIFFQGPNHTMINDWYVPSSGTWDSTTVPGSAYSAPAVQLDPDSAYAPTIFFQGPNHTMINDYYTPSNGSWNSTTAPGSAYSAPAAQLDPDSAYAPTIFFEGSGNTMVNDYYTPSNGSWNSTTAPW